MFLSDSWTVDIVLKHASLRHVHRNICHSVINPGTTWTKYVYTNGHNKMAMDEVIITVDIVN